MEFAGKKEYKCFKCKATIRYAKYFGSDGKILTTNGKEPFAGMVDGKFASNTGWPTDPMIKQMHECEKLTNSPATNEALTTIDQIQSKAETEVKRTDLLVNPEGETQVPRVRELNMDDMVMEKRKGEVLTECAIMFKEEIWITDYLLSKGGANPNPAKVGMWHKMIDERLRRVHDPD